MSNSVTPWGELPKEKKMELFEAYLDGKTIEKYIGWDVRWVRVRHPSWHPSYHYRIKPELPSINWDHVSPKYNFLYKDRFGGFRISTKPPIIHVVGDVYGYRTPACSRSIPATDFASLKEGDAESADSLVIRPGYKEG